MQLAVFDIDGTLTDTCAVDARCYGDAVGEVFGVARGVVEGEWESYPDITDSGIARTLVERHLGREIEAAELARLEAVFVELLTAELDRAPESCRPVDGAVEFLAELSASADWTVALATGGFRRSALLKLLRAGFDPPPALATASEAISRVEIVRAAMRRASRLAGREFQSVVVVGDGPWDVRAGRELEVPCVGVARGDAAAALLAGGAVAVLGDFRDRALARRVFSAATQSSG